MADRTVVMVAYWFPPCIRWPTAAERVRGLASWLPQHDWHPIVITPRLDRDDLCECPACGGTIDAPDVRSDAYEVHRLRVPPKIRYRFWRSVKRASGSADVSSGGGGRRRSLATTLSFAKGAVETRASWRGAVASHVEELARDRRIDAIWTTSGPYESIPLGHRLQRSLGIPWVADLRDPISEIIEPSPVRMLAKRLRHRWMRRHLRAADAVVGVTEASSERDGDWLGREVHTIPSGFDPARWEKVEPLRPRAPGFAVVFLGSLYPDDFDLDLLFRALKLLLDERSPRREIRLHYYGSDDAALVAAARRHDVHHLIVVEGTVPVSRARRVMAGADVLLLLEVTRRRGDSRIPGKLYEYLAAGRPVLAIPDVNPTIREILATTAAGTASSSAADIAEQLRSWSDDQDRPWRAGNVGGTATFDRFSITRSAGALAKLLGRAQA